MLLFTYCTKPFSLFYTNCIIFQEEKGEKRRVESLLNFLIKGAVDALDMFIYALRAAGQGYIADSYLRPPKVPDPCSEG